MMAEENGPPRKSNVISVRLDPRLKWAADLQAREERRTFASLVEVALDRYLTEARTRPAPDGSASASVVAAEVWDIDPADRFVKLALRRPELLNSAEQRIWKRVTESPRFWLDKTRPLRIEGANLDLPALRREWPKLTGRA